MSADLRSALRDAVAEEPTFSVDAAAIADAGGRRVRRRTRLAVAAAALSTVAVLAVVAVASRPADPEPAPAPAELVRLDLGSADEVPLDVIASTRTTWKDDGSDEFFRHDRLEGLTEDGLVLRNRRTGPSVGALLGLLDPRTGTTDWLPDPPANLYGMQPLALDVDRLVLGVGQGNGHSVLVFDRASRTWQRDIVRIPYGIEVHVPPRMVLAPDDRVYVGNTLENQPGPMRWWSAPVPGGGTAAPEPELEGYDVVWSGPGRIVADPDGRVVASTPAGETELSDRRPDGCEKPRAFPEVVPTTLWAGSHPVVTYLCDSESDVPGATTVVHDPEGGRVFEVPDASAVAADDSRVVLTSENNPGAEHPGRSSTYVLDLDGLTITRIGRGTHEPQVALAADLLLWNTPGPTDSQDAYDVVWNVARLD